MAVAGKKVLMVLPEFNFEDDEYALTRRMLESRGAKVNVASIRKGSVRGKKGTWVKVDMLVDEVKTWDYDAFIFVGGEGTRTIWHHPQVLKLAKDTDHKVQGAIDLAPAILAHANAHKDKRRRATAALAVARMLAEKGFRFTGEPVVVDEKLVTASAPTYVQPFAQALLKTMESS
ncbi:MAG: DJ-1/PfpI family protein [Abditibacteriales bacterium]|nr:DJ-1/PfpI family protein [Abditibacteriales bacterium]MDW8368150.1 DJ-1/PfpI family protein [Abditibacteriales bacterium]